MFSQKSVRPKEFLTKQERVEIRRSRIKSSLKTTTELEGEVETVKETKSKEDRFNQLYGQGSQQIMDVLGAFMCKETLRRKEAQIIRSDKLKELQKSEEKFTMLFEESMEGWLKREGKMPLDEYRLLQEEKAKCELILKKKEEEINEIRDIIRKDENNYEENLKELQNGISYIINKCECLLENVHRISQEEIVNLEDKSKEDIKISNEKYLEECKVISEETLKEERIKEQFLEREEERMKEDLNNDELTLIEECANYRRNVERDIYILSAELMRIKVFCLANQEKLEYNMQVLEKRKNEWEFVTSRQNDQLARLKKKAKELKQQLDEAEKDKEVEFSHLKRDCGSLNENLQNLTRRFQSMNLAQDVKYFDLSELRVDEIRETFSKVVTADRIIHEKILGLVCKTLKLDVSEKVENPPLNEEDLKIWKPWLLEAVCKEMDFLVKDETLEILVPIQEDRALLKFNAIMNVFGIKTKQDFDELTRHFGNCTEVISEGRILKAFEEFLKQKNSTDYRQKKDFPIKIDLECWEKYLQWFSENRIHLWDSIYKMQTNYFEILKTRSKLLKRKEDLVKENGDLKQQLRGISGK